MKLEILKEIHMLDEAYAIGDLIEIASDEQAKKMIADGYCKEYVEIKKISKPKTNEAPVITKDTVIETKTREAKTFGEFLMAVKRGEAIDPDIMVDRKSVDMLKAVEKDMIRAGKIEKAIVGQAVSSNAGADGGYTTQNQFLGEIQTLSRESSKLWNLVTRIPVRTGLTVPQVNETTKSTTSIFGGIRFYVPGEGVDTTVSKIAFTQKALTLNRVSALGAITAEMMEDNPAVQDLMLRDYILGLGQVMDREIMFGTLSAVANPLVNGTTGVAVSGANPNTYAILDNMYHAIDPAVRDQAVWIFSNDTHADLMATADAANRLIFNPGAVGSIAAGVPQTLFGLPIVVSSQLPAGGTTGNIILTVPSAFILAEGVSGVKSAFSDDVYFLSDQRVWRFDYRCNGCPRQASKVQLIDGTYVSNTAYIA